MPSAAVATADYCDANTSLLPGGDLRVLDLIFQMYGRRRSFSGPAATLRVFEDNVIVREALERPGEGRVLVVDGGGSRGSALLGGRLAGLARTSGWSGIVVNGCIRDVDEVNGCDLGVRAVGSCPVKPGKKGTGEKGVPVRVAGVWINEGEWIYADSDGVLVAKHQLQLPLPNSSVCF